MADIAVAHPYPIGQDVTLLINTLTDNGLVGGLNIGVRAGLGLEGALGDGSDGLVFDQIGLRADSPSTNKATGTALGNLSGSLSAAIPTRTSLSARVRVPLYLVPGDLLLLSPMYFLDRDRYTHRWPSPPPTVA